MSQHNSYDIPDQSGTSFRSDLNSYLQAVLSNNSGPTEPTSPAIGMLWYDTANHLIKVRNSTNTAWTTLASSVTGQVTSVDVGSDTSTVTGLSADTAGTPHTIVQRDGTGSITAKVYGHALFSDADTLQGYSKAQLQDMTNVVGRNYLSITPGDYMIYTGRISGSEAHYIKLPFAGSIRVFLWVRHDKGNNGISFGDPTSRFIVGCQNTAPVYNTINDDYSAGTYTAVTGDLYRCFYFDISVPYGYLLIEGIAGTYNKQLKYALGCAEHGIALEARSSDNLGDLYTIGGRSHFSQL